MRTSSPCMISLPFAGELPCHRQHCQLHQLALAGHQLRHLICCLLNAAGSPGRRAGHRSPAQRRDQHLPERHVVACELTCLQVHDDITGQGVRTSMLSENHWYCTSLCTASGHHQHVLTSSSVLRALRPAETSAAAFQELISSASSTQATRSCVHPG